MIWKIGSMIMLDHQLEVELFNVFIFIRISSEMWNTMKSTFLFRSYNNVHISYNISHRI